MSKRHGTKVERIGSPDMSDYKLHAIDKGQRLLERLVQDALTEFVEYAFGKENPPEAFFSSVYTSGKIRRSADVIDVELPGIQSLSDRPLTIRFSLKDAIRDFDEKYCQLSGETDDVLAEQSAKIRDMFLECAGKMDAISRSFTNEPT